MSNAKKTNDSMAKEYLVTLLRCVAICLKANTIIHHSISFI